MRKTEKFETLLPNTRDPQKARLRGKVLYILNSHGEILPPQETIAGKLWKLVNSENATLEECQTLIELDPVLTFRIFRIANSAAYRGRATTISDALFTLGFKVVREMVFNASIFSQFQNFVLPTGWEIFWLRNLFIARLTDRICSLMHTTDGTEYLAGLIHDIGLLFLGVYFPQEFVDMLNSAKPLGEAELDFLPFAHQDIGAAIATRSLLPIATVNGILYHHRSFEDTTVSLGHPRFLALVLKLADKIADGCQLNLLSEDLPSLDELGSCFEFAALNSLGYEIDLRDLIDNELPKAQETFSAFMASA